MCSQLRRNTLKLAHVDKLVFILADSDMKFLHFFFSLSVTRLHKHSWLIDSLIAFCLLKTEVLKFQFSQFAISFSALVCISSVKLQGGLVEVDRTSNYKN